MGLANDSDRLTGGRGRLLGRRSVLARGGLVGLGLAVAGFSPSRALAAPSGRDYPFTLGVASGDPTPDGVVLWTRLAPEPLALDGAGGMPDRKVAVQWQIGDSENFSRTVCGGEVYAVPELAHSVHVEVEGLRPDTTYYYRFRAMGEISSVGRTRTMPDPSTRLNDVRFAIASCQNWHGGFYTAYRHMADDDLDFVLHLGDYVYEVDIPIGGLHRKVDLPAGLRAEPWFLEEYRTRHALYKLDPDLQAAHQAHPFVVTWDDHEVEDNWAGDHSREDDEPDQDPAVFRDRRARAAQAYYEHLPFRLPQKPSGSAIGLHRTLRYGDLATFHILDGRQFRDDQACGDGWDIDCVERLDATRTMLGTQQENWLYDGLANSGTTWNVLGNQVPMAQVDTEPDARQRLLMDFWDGYKAARDRLFQAIYDRQVRNPVVVTGDMHRNLASNLLSNFDVPDSSVLGVEFVGTSISSGQDGEDLDDGGENILRVNPHVKFTNQQRGYTRCTATPSLCRADFQVMEYVSEPGAPIHTRASFVTEEGHPGLQQDAGRPALP